MTYRIGDHSTSDYSLIYREEKEIDTWRARNDPIKRLGSYLKKKNAFPFTEEEIKALRKSILDEVATSLKRQSETPLPKPDLLFDQVYDHPTANLLEQREENRRILREYPEEFKLERYDR